MARPRRSLRREDYTVGWIAAMPVELAPAIAMLDEVHFPLPQDENDPVIYHLGSIGPHNVVMACLSAGQTGTNSAATVATQMRATFPFLRFGLLVGIGGGVPSASDVRLGDIVVSQPKGAHPAIVQYDFGKATAEGFKRAMLTMRPPEILLNALSSYQALNLDPGGNLTSHRFKPKKSSKMTLAVFPAEDILFQADYQHVSGETCEKCDRNNLLKSPNRDQRGIMVHYGTIASGNQVIKDGTRRDQLSKELGEVLCFEMEAAGIMNTFPCLVIRGICDYADSHKNKEWQPYAALTAAAFTKELLTLIPPIRVPGLPPSMDLVETKKKSRFSSIKRSDNSNATLQPYNPGEMVEYEKVPTYSISQYDHIKTLRDLADKRCPETTLWLLEHDSYKDWHDTENAACVWLTGKIGSGKTLMTTTVIAKLKKEFVGSDSLVLHFFYRHENKSNFQAIDLLSSLVRQVIENLEFAGEFLPDGVEKHLSIHYGRQKLAKDFNAIVEDILEPLMKGLPTIYLIIDGLDEIENKEIWVVLKLVRSLLKKSNTKVFISGRESLDIKNSIPGAIMIKILGEEAMKDIATYIRWRVDEKQLEEMKLEDDVIREEFESTLRQNADHMIFWVSLQIDIIWELYSGKAAIREALKNLPKDLNETYDRCVQRIMSKQGVYSSGFAIKILSWLLEAIEPLSLTQLLQALAIDESSGALYMDRVPAVQDVLRSCANLVTINNDQSVTLAHHSVGTYLETHLSLGQLHQEVSLQGKERGLYQITDLSLARLCISHLTSTDYSLALQQVLKGPTVRIEPPAVNFLTSSVPWYIRTFLPGSKISKAVHINLPAPKPATILSVLPEFFHYARSAWPGLISRWPQLLGSSSLESSVEGSKNMRDHLKIKGVVLQPSLTWRLHPWEPVGQSLDSHYFGLLGWSIANKHKVMFDFLFNRSRFGSSESYVPVIRVDLFFAPFHQYDGLNSVQLAARGNSLWAIERIFMALEAKALVKLLGSKDSLGRTCLYHAVDVSARDTVAFLVGLLACDLTPDIDGVNPLELAARRGDIGIFMTVKQREQSSGDLKVNWSKIVGEATANGHVAMLDKIQTEMLSDSHLVTEDLLLGTFMPYMSLAVQRGHLESIRYLQSRTWDYRHPWQLTMPMLANILDIATQHRQEAIVEWALQEILYIMGDEDRIQVAKDLQRILMRIFSPTQNGQQRPDVSQTLSTAERIFRAWEQCRPSTDRNLQFLVEAIQNRNSQLLKFLLEQERFSLLNEDIRNGFSKWNTIKMAMQTQDKAIIESLLQYGFWKPDYSSYLLLREAIDKDNIELVKVYIDYGFLARSDEMLADSPTPSILLYAAGSASPDMLSLLLAKSESWSGQDTNGRTALMCTAPGRVDNVRIICEWARDQSAPDYINAVDHSGRSALFWSIWYGYAQTARILLRFGADPEIINEEGRTIVHAVLHVRPGKALEHTGSALLGQLIQEQKINVDMFDKSGRTALHVAVMNRSHDVIALLIRWGANINIKNAKGQTAVHLAAETRNDVQGTAVKISTLWNTGQKPDVHA